MWECTCAIRTDRKSLAARSGHECANLWATNVLKVLPSTERHFYCLSFYLSSAKTSAIRE